MATSSSIKSVSSATDYQLHDEQNIKSNVIDFTEKKLQRKIEQAKALRQKIMLQALLEDYITGMVAVSWRRGLPSAIRVTKDK